MVSAAEDRKGRGARAGVPPRVQPAAVRPRRGEAVQHPARRRLHPARRRLRPGPPARRGRLRPRRAALLGWRRRRAPRRRHPVRQATSDRAGRGSRPFCRRRVPRAGSAGGGRCECEADAEVGRVLVRGGAAGAADGARTGGRPRVAVDVGVVLGARVRVDGDGPVRERGARRRRGAGGGAVGAPRLRGGRAARGGDGGPGAAPGPRAAQEGGGGGVPRRARVHGGRPGAPAADEGRR